MGKGIREDIGDSNKKEYKDIEEVTKEKIDEIMEEQHKEYLSNRRWVVYPNDDTLSEEDIKDIEYVRDNIISGSRIPKEYFGNKEEEE